MSKPLVVLRALLLVAAPFFLALGLVLPLIRFQKLYFFSETPSLLEIIGSLWSGGDAFLASLISLVSVLLPLLKMIGLAMEASAVAGSGVTPPLLARLLPYLSKWSMMDVLLVAIVIAGAKATGLADAFTQPGLWCYAASTVAAGLLHSLVKAKEGPAIKQGLE